MMGYSWSPLRLCSAIFALRTDGSGMTTREAGRYEMSHRVIAGRVERGTSLSIHCKAFASGARRWEVWEVHELSIRS